MKYSLFGNDELGWTVARHKGSSFSNIEWYNFYYDQFVIFGVWPRALTTKEKAEEKLKELNNG